MSFEKGYRIVREEIQKTKKVRPSFHSFLGAVSMFLDRVFTRSASVSEIMQWTKKNHRLIDTDRISLMPGIILTNDSCSTAVAAQLDMSLVAVRIPRRTVKCANHITADLLRLMQVRHPNIAVCHGLCFELDRGIVPMVFEWVDGVHLERYVKSPPEGPNAVMRHHLLLDVCSALWYLHYQESGLVHGDVSGSSIVVESRSPSPRAKFLDIGWSRLLAPHSFLYDQDGRWATERRRHSLIWTAPEVLFGQDLTRFADVFAFGRLIYLVVCGRQPLASATMWGLEVAVRNLRNLTLDWRGEPLSGKAQILSQSCCARSQDERPTMPEVFQDLKKWLVDGSRSLFTSEPPSEVSWSSSLPSSTSQKPRVMRKRASI